MGDDEDALWMPAVDAGAGDQVAERAANSGQHAFLALINDHLGLFLVVLAPALRPLSDASCSLSAHRRRRQ